MINGFQRLIAANRMVQMDMFETHGKNDESSTCVGLSQVDKKARLNWLHFATSNILVLLQFYQGAVSARWGLRTEHLPHISDKNQLFRKGPQGDGISVVMPILHHE